MSDLISRQDAIEVVQKRPMMLSKEKVLLINDLEKLPSAEPKTGKWVDDGDPQKKQPITEDKIKAWLDMWEGYIDADMIARMKYRVIDIRNVQLSQAATDINVGHKAAGHGSNVPMQPNIPPMPSNTSNALKALNSVNTTQFNALAELADAYSGWDVPDTNVGEMITKQQVIDVLERVKRTANDILYDGPVLMSYNDVLDSLINIVNFLPPAQPESDSGRWERHYSRPGVYADLYWHCSKCGYKTDYQYANVNHRYCPNCGRKMEREVSDE